ncbi:hypothetical protein D3C78_1307200 [compost metagenome]
MDSLPRQHIVINPDPHSSVCVACGVKGIIFCLVDRWLDQHWHAVTDMQEQVLGIQ